MEKFTFYLLLLFSISASAQLSSDFIHIDQFGYLPQDEKIAVISNPQVGFNSSNNFIPSNTLELRNFSNDQVVFTNSPTIWNGGATHKQSGDRGWWFDFSSFNTPGEYYVHDPVANESSAVFKIENGVYNEVFKAAARMFYYNRCNDTKEMPYAEAPWADGMNFMNPLQDANCRYYFDKDNVALEKDLTGGWFDAGDYNKYVTFAFRTVDDLLWAFEENPQAFGDDWNIPESNNGLPDLIDELKWEFDWLLKMNNSDGSTIIKMGSQSHSENFSAPPSINTDQRFYGKTCTSASIAAAAMFAHGAEVFKKIPSLQSYAQTLEERAIKSWEYVLPFLDQNNLETGCDSGEIKSGDADWTEKEQKENALVAAVYLYRLTNNNSYNTYVSNNYNQIPRYTSMELDQNNMPFNDALLTYASLDGADETAKQEITAVFTDLSGNNWLKYYGVTDEDLYLAHMPDWGYNWGSNRNKAIYGNLNKLVSKMAINPNESDSFLGYIDRNVHYFHGTNPMGLVYLTNMKAYDAEKSCNEMFHLWFNDNTDWDHADNSLYGPAPGYIVGGPNPQYTISALTPPHGQPMQKSYLDFNSTPNESWQISEPAIYYQAAYLRMLANKITADETLSITDHSVFDQQIFVYPNPTEDQITINGLQVGDKITLSNMLGQKIQEVKANNAEIIMPVKYLNQGIYIVDIKKRNNKHRESHKIVKR